MTQVDIRVFLRTQAAIDINRDRFRCTLLHGAFTKDCTLDSKKAVSTRKHCAIVTLMCGEPGQFLTQNDLDSGARQRLQTSLQSAHSSTTAS